jgi:hypothetical protein
MCSDFLKKNCLQYVTLEAEFNVFYWKNSRFIKTVHHRVHCVKEKKGHSQIKYRFFSCITGIEAKMLLIIVLGLIYKLPLVLGSFDNETSTLTDSDWNSMAISVSTCLLLSAADKNLYLVLYFIYLFCVYYHFI